VTTVARLSRADRDRLERERELAEFARLMRQPGSLAEAPEPVPLHRTNRDATKERTTS
jgi:adenylylsulfate kinase-like enzyme